MMKAVLEFFDARWLQILGYTLLHSLWEAFIVAVIVILVLRFIPNKSSTVRHILASFGLITIVSLLVGTFIYLFATSTETTTLTAAVVQSSAPKLAPLTSVSTYLEGASAFIQYCLPIFLMVWVFGTSLF